MATVAEARKYRFPNATSEDAVGYLSPSQINEFRDCPRCYHAGDRCRLREREDAGAAAGLHGE